MLGPVYRYTKELYGKFKYLATWLPNVPISLGDVGVVKDNVFVHIGTLKDYGIKFKERDAGEAVDLLYQSTSVTSIDFKLAGVPAPAGSGLVEAKAGVTITFAQQAGVVFVAKGCTVTSIQDQVAIGEKIKKLFHQGKWDRSYSVVTEVVSAKALTVLVSESGGGKLDLVAEGKLTSGVASLADVKAGLNVTSSRSMHFQAVARTKCTPLFQVRRLHRPWYVLPLTFSATGVDPMQLDPPDQIKPEELVFGHYVPPPDDQPTSPGEEPVPPESPESPKQ